MLHHCSRTRSESLFSRAPFVWRHIPQLLAFCGIVKAFFNPPPFRASQIQILNIDPPVRSAPAVVPPATPAPAPANFHIHPLRIALPQLLLLMIVLIVILKTRSYQQQLQLLFVLLLLGI